MKKWFNWRNKKITKRIYSKHDNFITDNMSEAGYKKMVQALKEYLKALEISQTDNKKRWFFTSHRFIINIYK